MSKEGSKRAVVLSVESDDPRAGGTHIIATDPETGERVELLGVTHVTIVIDPHRPPAVHLEVIPDRINVPAVLEYVEEKTLA